CLTFTSIVLVWRGFRAEEVDSAFGRLWLPGLRLAAPGFACVAVNPPLVRSSIAYIDDTRAVAPSTGFVRGSREVSPPIDSVDAGRRRSLVVRPVPPSNVQRKQKGAEPIGFRFSRTFM